MQKAVTEVEVRRDAEEDPGRVDWVTSHPPLEQPPPSPPKKYIYNAWKNKRKYVCPKNLVKPTSRKCSYNRSRCGL